MDYRLKINPLLFLFWLWPIISLKAQFTAIPDPNFELALIELGHDDLQDGQVLTTNISGITQLNVSYKNITDLTGIKDFVALTSLSCYANQMTSLDVSGLTSLAHLHCYSNALNSLNVAGATSLTVLNCYDNNLTQLDVSGAVNLVTLNCNSNALTSLDISANTAMVNLICTYNQLTELVIGTNNVLTDLSCHFNQLTDLDVSGATALVRLYCEYNQLTNLNLSGVISLERLRCYGNNLLTLDVSGAVALTHIDCYNNALTGLDVSTNTALTNLNCNSNALTGLTIGANSTLISLNCDDNQLTDLEVIDAVALTHLYCNFNNLTNLNINGAISLQALRCYSNYLTTLDVSDATALIELRCYDNELTALDVSANTALSYLNCYGNQLTSLEIGANSALTQLYCHTNQLTDLAVIDAAQLTRLYCYSNNLASLNITGATALTLLRCAGNYLTGLDVSDAVNLDELDCSYNTLIGLDVSTNTALTYLNCFGNHLTSLEIGPNSALTELRCGASQLTHLDLGNAAALKTVLCQENNLTDITVSGATAITQLWCYSNNLPTLDVTANTLLTDLQCHLNTDLNCIQVADETAANQSSGIYTSWIKEAEATYSENCHYAEVYVPDDNFEQALIDLGYDAGPLDDYIDPANINAVITLDVSSLNIASLTGIEAFTALANLNCSDNNLSVLPVEANTELTILDCSSNVMVNLDLVANVLLTELNATNNPNLICIHVANEVDANGGVGIYTNWQKDIPASYSENCYVNYTYVPDDNFEQALIDLGYDDVLDDYVLTANINGVTGLNVTYKNIADLTGIKDFVALTGLSCQYNQLTHLDLSGHSALASLNCYQNNLITLDVSNIPTLGNLECYSNNLTDINVTGATGLSYFRCMLNNLSSLDVSTNTALGSLSCYNNQLTSLDVSNNPNLTNLSCVNNQLTSLIIGDGSALTTLDCRSNKLSSLAVTNATALTSLNCYSNQLTSLNISGATSLGTLTCSGNKLPDLDVSDAVSLTNLTCTGNALTSLDVSNNPNLTYLTCNNNQLVSLEIGINNALTTVYCNSNQLISLDVSQAPGLQELSCYYNSLTSLDVSTNLALTALYCYANQLTSLTVPENSALTRLRCNTNYLTSLTVVNAASLLELQCQQNFLTSLDIPGATALTTLYCQGNQLAGLNLTDATALTTLHCYKNALNSLDVSNNTALVTLQCQENKLTTLITGTNNVLNNIHCYENKLDSLDLSENPALSFLNCHNNQLKKLEIDSNDALEQLHCYGNLLDSLDVSDNTALNVLRCQSNNLTNLNITGSNALTLLHCNYNYLESIDDLSNFPSLASLDLRYNSFPQFQDLSNHPNEANMTVNFIYNYLDFVSLEQNLTGVDMHEFNAFTYISQSNANAVVVMACGQTDVINDRAGGVHTNYQWKGWDGNAWTDIPGAVNPDLADFDQYLYWQFQCSMTNDWVNAGNMVLKSSIFRITEGIVPDTTEIAALEAFYNSTDGANWTNTWPISNPTDWDNITSIAQIDGWYGLTLQCNDVVAIDLANNNLSGVIPDEIGDLQALTSLNLSQGGFISMPSTLSNLTDLTDLNVSSNNFLTLDLSFNTLLGGLDIQDNADLACIQVANEAEANQGVGIYTNWLKDDAAVYSENCHYDDTYVPDDQFEQVLIDLGYDVGPLDDYVPTINISGIEILEISDNWIFDLTGIEDFAALTELQCSGNMIASLDLSGNPNLVNLYCSNTQLTSLNVTQNPNLELLECNNNYMTTLNLIANSALVEFDCSINDFSNLVCIQVADEVAANQAVGIYTNWLKAPEASYSEDCQYYEEKTYVPDENFEIWLGNQNYDTQGAWELDHYVPTYKISGVTSLDIWSAEIADFTGIEGFVALTELEINNNIGIVNFDISANNSLEVLGLYSVDFQFDLDISGHSSLTHFYFSTNVEPQTLTLNNCPSLVSVTCANNSFLTTTTVSQNPVLQWLNFSYNGLFSNMDATLNASGNPALEHLTAHFSQLTAIDVSGNPALVDLNCEENQLTTLDVSQNLFLEDFRCGFNNLSCIQVADEAAANQAHSNGDWHKDFDAIYSEDCHYGETYVPDNNFEQALIDLGYDAGPLDDYVLTANIDIIPNLDISNKNIADLTGIAAFAALNYLYCNDNVLTTLGLHEDANLTELHIQNNSFRFEGILPLIDKVSDSYLYSPQSKIGQAINASVLPGDNYQISLGIDEGINPANEYNWHKDGNPDFFISSNNYLDLQSLKKADEGTYVSFVTNPDAPDLTLESYPVTLSLDVTDLPSDSWCSQLEEFTLQGAGTQNLVASCWNGAPPYSINWYAFQATTSEVEVQVLTGGAYGTMQNAQLVLWDENNTELVCGSYALTDPSPKVFYQGLTPNDTYYIAITGTPGTFSLCIDNIISEDFAEGAEEIIDIDNYCSTLGAFTTQGMTPDRSAASCWNPEGPYHNVWFKFQAPGPEVMAQVQVGGIEGTLNNPQIALWDASFNELDCSTYLDDANPIVSYNSLTPGAWYYISVDGEDIDDAGTFTLCMDDVFVCTDDFMMDFAFGNDCMNKDIQFVDNSTVSSGIIVSRYWDFGDGTSSVQDNPVKAYATAGDYSVKLVVTTDKGCVDSLTQIISIYLHPQIVINEVQSATCPESTDGKVVFIVSGGLGTYSYQIKNINNDFIYASGNATENTPVTVNDLIVGHYLLLVIDVATSCSPVEQNFMIESGDPLACAVTYVPDDNFEQALIDLGYDTGPLDDYVPTGNINTITILNVNARGISDMTGIEDFIALVELYCAINKISTIDVSNLLALEIFHCYSNRLEELDLSANVELREGDFDSNYLTIFNASKNTKLEIVDVGGNNLNSINISNCPELAYLSCHFNALPELDVSKNIKLKYLNCSANNLNSLAVDNNTELTYLSLSYSSIATIDLSKNTLLEYIDARSCKLLGLDVSKNILLKSVYCGFNQLTEFNTENSPDLEVLNCRDNEIEQLNLDNPALRTLSCFDNALTQLDVSKSTSLEELYCFKNKLTTLNARGSTFLTHFDASDNPDLTCIEVDNEQAANAGTGIYADWEKDAGASYGEDCSPPVNCADSLLTANFLVDTEVGVGDTIQFIQFIPDSVDFLWDFGDGITSTLVDPVHIYLDSGSYNVSLTVYSENCTDTRVKTISVLPLRTAVDPDNSESTFFSILEASISPNPSSGQYNVHVLLSEEKEITLKFLTQSGRFFAQKKITETEINQEFDFSFLPAGMYIVQIVVDNKIKVFRFLKI